MVVTISQVGHAVKSLRFEKSSVVLVKCKLENTVNSFIPKCTVSCRLDTPYQLWAGSSVTDRRRELRGRLVPGTGLRVEMISLL